MSDAVRTAKGSFAPVSRFVWHLSDVFERLQMVVG